MSTDVKEVKKLLVQRFETLETKTDILKQPELKGLYEGIRDVPADKRREYGQAINTLKGELETMVAEHEAAKEAVSVVAIDVTAPFDINVPAEKRPGLLASAQGSLHPLMSELERIIDIFTRMGFEAGESRQLDDDFNMFTALNFPENHPARDGYDTFRTEEGLLPPAHTSTMQHRILKQGKEKLEHGGHIANISYGRVFRNEDVDATHEHTFYQVEGVFVSKDASLAQMIGVLKTFFETYYGQSLKIKTQPGYFPFVEPGLEFLIEKPASLGGKEGDWLEMLGCGMIHPNVLELAGIDPKVYSGFAWGGGVDRLVMLAHNIEDVRHFESGKLAFLRKFA